MRRTMTASFIALAALTGAALAQSTQQTAPGTGSSSTPPTATTTQPAPPSAPATQPGTPPRAAGQGAGQTGAAMPQGMQAIVTSTVPMTFMTVGPADVMTSNLIGVDVYTQNSEEIGEIEDMVIDNGRTVRALVIGIGGFLGMGERYVAVPPESVTLMRPANGGEVRAVVNTTAEQLRAAPTFRYEGKWEQ